ncbi:MAG: hypothetical protein M1540_03710 [Candidatus Bathyarchaeota archaeon]|nr:hypothetical protein [Candidatus Bathyarchaeota archaeon]
MSTEKEKLNQILAKVEEISVTLNKVSEELRSVSASLKSLAVGQITAPPKPASSPSSAFHPPPPQPTPKTASPPAAAPESPKLRSLDDIRMSFPEELESRLSFEEKGDYIIIKPKQFLGSENFAKIASAVRGMGGEYISAGKDSHFRVPKKKT